MIYQLLLPSFVPSGVGRFFKLVLKVFAVITLIWIASYVSHGLLSMLPLWAWWFIGFLGLFGYAAFDAFVHRGKASQYEDWISDAKVSALIVSVVYVFVFVLFSILYYLTGVIHGIGQLAYDEWMFWTVLAAITAIYHFRSVFRIRTIR